MIFTKASFFSVNFFFQIKIFIVASFKKFNSVKKNFTL